MKLFAITFLALAYIATAAQQSSRSQSGSDPSITKSQSFPLKDRLGFDMSRSTTISSGYKLDDDKQRVTIRSPGSSSEPSVSDKVARIFSRGPSSLKPSESAIIEETVEVDCSQAALLEMLQKACPNLQNDVPDADEGRLGALFRNIKHHVKSKLQCLPCFRESDANGPFITDRANEEKWAGMTIDNLMSELQTDSQTGLSSDEVQRRIESIGANVLDKPKSTPFYEIMWEAINNAIVWLMVAGITAKFVTKKITDAVVMLLCVLFLIGMGTLPEWQATRQANNLAIEAPGQVQVLRDGQPQMISAEQLVPGDIITLRTGDRAPADCRVIESNCLQITEAELTGESELIEKSPEPVQEPGSSGTYDNLILMGTMVANGDCTAVVVETGMRARYGSIQDMLIMKERKSTPLTDKVSSLVLNFTKFTVGVATVLSATCIGLRRIPDPNSSSSFVLQNLMLGLELCIAVIPEGLPIVCALALNSGMKAMKEICNTRARTMSAVECLSSVDVFCTDKTGTLTTGKMTVVGVYVPGSEFRLLADGQAVKDDICAGQRSVVYDGPELDLIMSSAALCNSAELLDGAWKGQMSDVALAEVAHKRKIDAKKIFDTIATNTFDSKRKMMSVVVNNNPENPIFASITDARYVAVVKGAPEKILDLCDDLRQSNGEIHQLSMEDRHDLQRRARILSESGYRILALAYRPLPSRDDLSPRFVEDRLVFVGFMAIVDPLRDSVQDTVRRLHQAGIAVKMITGDSIGTASAIARQARILYNADPFTACVECTDLQALRKEVDDLFFRQLLLLYKCQPVVASNPDLLQNIARYLKDGDTPESVGTQFKEAQTELDDFVERTAVFARAQPEDKVTIVESVQRRKHIVAMTGDGVNDAPALKKADAGIAVKSATDLAKRAAPVNLLDEDFTRVGQIICEGRRVAYNMVKAVFCMFGGNVGELGPFLGQLGGIPAPLRGLQVLWLNANTDIFNITPFANDQPVHDLMADLPISPSAPVLKYWHWVQIIGINLLTTMFSYFILLFGNRRLTGSFLGHVSDPHSTSAASAFASISTAVTTFMVVSQLLLSYTCRNLEGSFVGREFFTNWPMHAAIIGSSALTIGVPFIPKVNHYLEMHSMPYLLLIVALACSPCLMLGHEAMKLIRRRNAIRFTDESAVPPTPDQGLWSYTKSALSTLRRLVKRSH